MARTAVAKGTVSREERKSATMITKAATQSRQARAGIDGEVPVSFRSRIAAMLTAASDNEEAAARRGRQIVDVEKVHRHERQETNDDEADNRLAAKLPLESGGQLLLPGQHYRPLSSEKVGVDRRGGREDRARRHDPNPTEPKKVLAAADTAKSREAATASKFMSNGIQKGEHVDHDGDGDAAQQSDRSGALRVINVA